MDYSEINSILRQHLWDEYKNKRPLSNKVVFKQHNIEIQLSENTISSIIDYDSDDNKIIDDNEYLSEYTFNHAIREDDLTDIIKDVFDLYLHSKYNRFNGIRVLSNRSDSITIEIYLRY